MDLWINLDDEKMGKEGALEKDGKRRSL